MRLVYTSGVPGSKPLAGVHDYYERILPFYEKEQESIPEVRLRFWRSLARRERPRRILDLGAGLGGITFELARHAPTIGTDISLPMLESAIRRLPPRSRARFIAADMRRPAFGAPFDLIVASSDPFCHLPSTADRRRALQAAASQLSDRGCFVLEGLHRRREVYEPPARGVRHATGVLTIREKWRPVGNRQLWDARYRYEDRLFSGEESGAEAAFTARAWDPADIRSFFASCGLRIEDLWGDFDGRTFRPGSPRILVAARKS